MIAGPSQQPRHSPSHEPTPDPVIATVRVDPSTDPQLPECPYCYLQPCVTTHEQRWLGRAQPPKLNNRLIRKEKYKKFWCIMDQRGAWKHPSYVHKKNLAMTEDINGERVWIQSRTGSPREIMPECILKVVRGMFPNPTGYPYMGHKWH